MSWWLYPILLVYFVVCIFLMLIILIQSGKGGGLSSLGSASGGIGDALGATSAERTLNKITSGFFVAFMLLAIFLSIFGAGRGGGDASEVFGDAPPPAGAQAPLVPGAADPSAPPAAPAPDAPAANAPAADAPAAAGTTNPDPAPAAPSDAAPAPAAEAPAAEAPAPEAPAQP